MNFAIVGTVNRDRVIAPAGSEHRSLGGVLYNALTLARCIADGDTIRVIARLGEEDRDETLALLGAYPAIDTSGLVFRPGASNEATLAYTSPEHRGETLVDRVGSLSDEELMRAAGADFVLANLISGWDFTPAQLQMIARTGARVLLDVQSLTLTPPGPDRTRAFCAVPDWRAWCEPVEIVKGNEQEIAAFTGIGLAAPSDFERAAQIVLDAGPRALVVTLGVRGCYAAWRESREARGSLQSRFIPAIPNVRIVDSTGCGDGFASAFLAEYAHGGDPLRAACAGNALAALVAATRGLDALRALPDSTPLRHRLRHEADTVSEGDPPR